MPIARFEMPDGRIARFEVPDGTTPEQAQQMISASLQPAAQPAEQPETADPLAKIADPGFYKQAYKDAASGALRGAASIGSTLLWPIDKVMDMATGDRAPTASGIVAGQQPLSRNQERRAATDSVIQNDFGADKTSLPFRVFETASQFAGTAGLGGGAGKAIGGLLSKVAPSVAGSGTASGLITALETSGATGGNIASRAAGGAASGALQAGAIDPESAKWGALLGGAAPVVFKAAGLGGEAAAGLLRPFFKAGQEKIAAQVLTKFASDPKRAIAELQKASELIPGSAPLSAAASGDVGLSGLTRTLQNTPEFAAELAARQAQQNAARTGALESVAGNAGKISAAKEARDAATSSMRETALGSAGKFPARGIQFQIDRMLENPSNAGETAQAALSRIKTQLQRSTDDAGNIDARALYEIRKDAGLAMQGKLQGDASNLRYAKGQLDKVQGVFDGAIERAAMRRPVAQADRNVADQGEDILANAIGLDGKGNGLAIRSGSSLPSNRAGSNVATHTPSQNGANQAGEANWSKYLSTYSEMSKPINQMEMLQDVLKRVQNGSTDSQGNLILSSAKLNNILKNEGADLAKTLAPNQMQLLRNISADLNANQQALSAGKSVGSNTVQNLAGDMLLQNVLGKIGASSPAKTTLGGLLKIPYVRANPEIQQTLANALLDPQYAARIMQKELVPGAGSRLVPLSSLTNRVLPLLPATSQ